MEFENTFLKIRNIFLLILTLLLILHCSSNQIKKDAVNYEKDAVNYEKDAVNYENVTVLNIDDSVPPNAKFISDFKIGYLLPPLLSQYKNYDSLITDAKSKTAKLGGNILKIVSHTPYQVYFGKEDLTRHKIEAKAYFSENLSEKIEKSTTDSNNETTLYFYMFDQGPLVKKDIYLNDKIIIKNFGSKMKSKIYFA